MKMDNKILSLIFFGLLALLIAKKTILKPSTRSFRQVLTTFVDSEVDKITIQLENQTETTLTRNGEGWQVNNGSMTVDAKPESVNTLISALQGIPTKQLVSRNPEKWQEYEVDDTKARKIVLFSNGKELASIHVGRFNFNQQTRSGVSYARLSSEDDIYALDGFLSMTVNRDFNSFRESRMLTFEPSSISTIQVEQLAATDILSLSLENQWLKNEIPVDSAAVVSYMQGLNNLNGTQFNDAFNPASANKLKTWKAGDMTVDLYDNNEGGFVMKSNQNPAFFNSDSIGIFQKVFVDFDAL